MEKENKYLDMELEELIGLLNERADRTEIDYIINLDLFDETSDILEAISYSILESAQEFRSLKHDTTKLKKQLVSSLLLQFLNI